MPGILRIPNLPLQHYLITFLRAMKMCRKSLSLSIDLVRILNFDVLYFIGSINDNPGMWYLAVGEKRLFLFGLDCFVVFLHYDFNFFFFGIKNIFEMQDRLKKTSLRPGLKYILFDFIFLKIFFFK